MNAAHTTYLTDERAAGHKTKCRSVRRTMKPPSPPGGPDNLRHAHDSALYLRATKRADDDVEENQGEGGAETRCRMKQSHFRIV